MNGFESCPECGTAIIADKGFSSWCPECNWNVNPLREEESAGLLQRIYERMGRTVGEALKRDAKLFGFERTGGWLTRFWLLGLSLFINGFTLFLAFVGMWLLTTQFPNPFAIIGAIILIGMAWIVRPQLGKLPSHTLSRDKHGALYSLVDRVCDSMDAPHFDFIVIDDQFNAFCGQCGIKRRRVLTLGLPLIDILKSQELVALIGHEAAHGRNNDPFRGIFAGTAIHTLFKWHHMLYPDCLWEPEEGIRNLGIIPMKLIFLCLSYLVKGLAVLIMHLGYRESQLAEFRADLFGSQVAGTKAMLAMMEKCHYDNTVYNAQQTYTLAGQNQSFWAILQEHVNALPANELERLRRMQQIEGARMDSTHPPTVDRLQVINSHPFDTPKVQLSENEYTRIKNDLVDYYERIEHKIKDDYRNSLYQ